jgi:integrase
MLHKIRRRKGRGFVLDYRDELGKRHEPTFATREELDTFMREHVIPKAKLNPVVAADITVAEYMTRWLYKIRPRVEQSTIVGYESTVSQHVIAPPFGDMPMRAVKFTHVLDFLTDKLRATNSKNPKNLIRRIKHVLHAAFNLALREELVLSNPVKGVAGELKITSKTEVEPKAMNEAQLKKFLAVVKQDYTLYYPMFLMQARVGLRPGEAYGALRKNLDFAKAEYYVETAKCQLVRKLDDPKTKGSKAKISLKHSPQLLRELAAHVAALPEEQELLFPNARGTTHVHSTVSNLFPEILKKAGLPTHFTPHGLRHTYASQALARGESILFVQQQLRHRTASMTTDLYGRWLPKQSMVPVGMLDDDPTARANAVTKQLDELIQTLGGVDEVQEFINRLGRSVA